VWIAGQCVCGPISVGNPGGQTSGIGGHCVWIAGQCVWTPISVGGNAAASAAGAAASAVPPDGSKKHCGVAVQIVGRIGPQTVTCGGQTVMCGGQTVGTIVQIVGCGPQRVGTCGHCVSWMGQTVRCGGQRVRMAGQTVCGPVSVGLQTTVSGGHEVRIAPSVTGIAAAAASGVAPAAGQFASSVGGRHGGHCVMFGQTVGGQCVSGSVGKVSPEAPPGTSHGEQIVGIGGQCVMRGGQCVGWGEQIVGRCGHCVRRGQIVCGKKVIPPGNAAPMSAPAGVVPSGGMHTVSGAQTVGSGHCVIGSVTGPGPPGSHLQIVCGHSVCSGEGQIVFGQPVIGNVGRAAPPPFVISSSAQRGQIVGIGGQRVGSGGQMVS